MADAVKGTKRYAGGSYQEDAHVVARAMHVPGKDKFVFVTLGEEGVFQVTSKADGEIEEIHHPAVHVPASSIKSTNGAGDTFSGALAYFLLQHLQSHKDVQLDQETMSDIVKNAMLASACSLLTAEAVPSMFQLPDV